MIFRVNFGFHGRSFGAPAPVFKMAVGTDLGRSITQQAPQNKPRNPDLPALAGGPIWGWQQRWSGLMSAAEQLEGGRGEAPARLDAAPSEVPAIEAVLTEQASKGGARLRPLLELAPYVARYRGRAILALIALTIAAVTTLVVPVAVRRMIDFGFTPKGIAMINSYFSVMIAVVAVLAGASASRFYLVMTIGERIVADLRRDVFAHLMSLSPAFFEFDTQRRADLAPHRRYHPDQIGGRRLGIDRVAQHHAVPGRHRDDGDHQPAAFRLRVAGDPGDRDSAGRIRALGAPAVARRAGYAGKRDRLRFRADRRHPHRAGLYQRTAGQCAFRRRGRAGL